MMELLRVALAFLPDSVYSNQQDNTPSPNIAQNNRRVIIEPRLCALVGKTEQDAEDRDKGLYRPIIHRLDSCFGCIAFW